MGVLSKATANVIGLTQEARAHNKASKESTSDPVNTQSVITTEDVDEESSDDDESYWKLDEVQEELNPESNPGPKTRNVAELLNWFKEKYPVTSHRVHNPLPCPVVIPQRRPQHKDRGFVRAYAPVLRECGIDQTTFFAFLDGFEQAIKMHPVFHAVNLGVLGGAIAIDAISGPSLMGHAVAFAMHASVEASRRGFIQYETNKYLDGMNEIFFNPLGLYCMIMTYKPESNNAMETSQISDNVVKAVTHRNEGKGGKFSSSSGTTRNDLEISEVAPLIFPDLDALREDDIKKQNALKKYGNFMSDYYDRRSQAKFEQNHPDSNLNVPRQEFASKYSDPNHPASSGGFVSLVTGGARTRLINRGAVAELSEKRQKKKKASGEPKRKKVLRQDVFYLIIVNMPSEEELQIAEQEMQRM